MNFITAIVLYLSIVIASMQQWLLLLVVAVCLFSVNYNTLVLIPAAIALDGYYGAFYDMPWLSISAIAVCVTIELVRPRFVSKTT